MMSSTAEKREELFAYFDMFLANPNVAVDGSPIYSNRNPTIREVIENGYARHLEPYQGNLTCALKYYKHEMKAALEKMRPQIKKGVEQGVRDFMRATVEAAGLGVSVREIYSMRAKATAELIGVEGTPESADTVLDLLDLVRSKFSSLPPRERAAAFMLADYYMLDALPVRDYLDDVSGL